MRDMDARCDYVPGDVVRIMGWDEMIAQNHQYSTGDPNRGGLSFTRPMRKLCGMELKVQRIGDYDGTTRLYFTRQPDPSRDWIIADWMVKPANPDQNVVSDEDAMSVLFEGGAV